MSDDLPGGSYRTEKISYIDEHLLWMRRSGRADSTLKARRRSLTFLAEHAGRDPFELSVDDIEAWLSSISSEQNVRLQFHMASPYYRWLHARGYRSDNPMFLANKPPRRLRRARSISEANLEKAIQTAPQRELPWLLLAGWVGLQAQEISTMRRDRIRIDGRGRNFLLAVDGKANEREVGIPEWIWEIIEPLMSSEGWCWRREREPGRGIDPPTAQHVSQYCNSHLHRVLDTSDTLTSVRYRAAHKAFEQTLTGHNVVQHLLGYNDPKQTDSFANMAIEALSVSESLPRPGINMSGRKLESTPSRSVFISYARPDSIHATAIFEAVSVLQFEPWMDPQLVGGKEWWDGILGQIRASDILVFVASSAAMRSIACRSEVNYAASVGCEILPICVDLQAYADITLPWLADIQWIDWVEKNAELKLARALFGADRRERYNMSSVPPPPVPRAQASSIETGSTPS